MICVPRQRIAVGAVTGATAVAFCERLSLYSSQIALIAPVCSIVLQCLHHVHPVQFTYVYRNVLHIPVFMPAIVGFRLFITNQYYKFLPYVAAAQITWTGAQAVRRFWSWMGTATTPPHFGQCMHQLARLITKIPSEDVDLNTFLVITETHCGCCLPLPQAIPRFFFSCSSLVVPKKLAVIS